MYSNLKSIVLSLAESKGIEVTETRQNRIRDVERDLDSGKITPEQTIEKLRAEFRYEFSSENYSSIRKSIVRKS